MLAFVRKEGRWSVYLYTEKDIDLSVIAKKYGGGVPDSRDCGFQCEKLPFKLAV